jgi:FdhE protein
MDSGNQGVSGTNKKNIKGDTMMTAEITRMDKWIEEHPYLKEFAGLNAVIENINSSYNDTIAAPDWELYSDNYKDGIPILESGFISDAVITSASILLKDIADRMADTDLPQRLIISVKELKKRIDNDNQLPVKIISGALQTGLENSDADVPVSGVELFIAWTALARVLRPVVDSFIIWRDESLWNRGYCPTCGSAPGIALLVEAKNSGKLRHLACSLCHTKWSYRRLGCPFCSNESPDSLEIFELENDPDIRLDVCNECKGYLKTCTRENLGDIVVLDWTTLHLDSIGKGKGYKRIGATLYEL